MTVDHRTIRGCRAYSHRPSVRNRAPSPNSAGGHAEHCRHGAAERPRASGPATRRSAGRPDGLWNGSGPGGKDAVIRICDAGVRTPATRARHGAVEVRVPADACGSRTGRLRNRTTHADRQGLPPARCAGFRRRGKRSRLAHGSPRSCRQVNSPAMPPSVLKTCERRRHPSARTD